ncbi:hypothetical protein HZC21_04225 [Candidatus Peregrinibacteria bacterium]|nr:hypothetical protein [Candidatus Peregrinibacteria bacterium]
MIKKQYLLFLVIIALFFGMQSVQSASWIYINFNNSETKTRQVGLGLSGPDGVDKMMISNYVDFRDGYWESFQSSKIWYLTYGSGTKSVYVKYKDKSGKETVIFNDTIQLTVPKDMQVDFTINKNDKNTNSRYVSLAATWSAGVESVRFSNNAKDFSQFNWVTISKDFSWVLTSGSGDKNVYAQFIDGNGVTKTVSKKITYKQPTNYLAEGTLLKGQTSTIYYLGFDGKLHPFFNSAIYHSWYPDFKNILQVSNAKLQQYSIGSPVCARQGIWLVRFGSSERKYAVEPGCRLAPIWSDTHAQILYGPKWKKRVLALPEILESTYSRINSDFSTSAVDNDSDWVDKVTEDSYGSSDFEVDSDSDGLGDYEEVFYWFSDPASKDTDNDGFNDGAEVVKGYSPVGGGKFAGLPTGTYSYPKGTIVKEKTSGNLYYVNSDDKYYSVSDNAFTANYFDSKFVVKETFDIPFSSSGGLSSTAVESIYRPQAMTDGGGLINL